MPAPNDILVVDDDEANLLAIEVALGDLGRRLVKARSGSEALRHLLDQDFCLILLDVQMPGMDGFETARLIRARRRSNHTPIIFVTAYSRNDSDILTGYSLGAVDFLFKPIVPTVLRAKASVFVQLQHQTDEVRRQGDQLRTLEQREHARRLAEERQRLEAELLREENRRKDEFLAMLAHELRNPLAPMVTGLELMKMSGLENATLEKTRASMERQVLHLTRLVDDLLDVSRITQGKITLRREPVDVQDVVRQAVDSLQQSIAERGQELVVEGPEEPLHTMGDGVRLTQVVANLLSNASRYTDRDGRIEVRYGQENGEIRVCVRDNGRGIAPEMLERVFDLFVQERDGGKGLGLGLTLVHRLVEMHGGSVHASSDGRGRGSTFEVCLPAGLDDAHDGQRDEQTGELQLLSQSLRIVVVEDEPDVRETVRALLEGWGHEVEVAEDGAQGVERILALRPDVALLDIGLPQLDGYCAAEQVRAELGAHAPRLIAVTGWGTSRDRERAREAGFDAHLVKPARPEELRRVLRRQDVHHDEHDGKRQDEVQGAPQGSETADERQRRRSARP